MNEHRKLKTNYHTHTVFCDGKETPESMIIAAIEKKFDILGFSGHSMYPFASNWHIAPREHKLYVETIRNLAVQYSSKIQILCGFEADYIPGICTPRIDHFTQFKPDYLIGSVHYIVTEKGNFTVDDTAENVKAGIDHLFNGNSKEAVCTYFALEREMIQAGNFTILGHCDLFRKRNGVLHLFDERESWYRSELLATASEIQRAAIPVEINTGAIARNAMDDIYPSADFLEILHDSGVPVIINSDAHCGADLDCAFDRAEIAAKKAGYMETVILEAGSLRSQRL